MEPPSSWRSEPARYALQEGAPDPIRAANRAQRTTAGQLDCVNRNYTGRARDAPLVMPIVVRISVQTASGTTDPAPVSLFPLSVLLNDTTTPKLAYGVTWPPQKQHTDAGVTPRGRRRGGLI